MAGKTTVSRRQFLKRTGAGAIGVGAAAMAAPSVLPLPLSATGADADAAPVDKKQFVAALADTIIPTEDGYPGYRRLEQYGITDEVLKALGGMTQQEIHIFNAAPQEFFNGKTFINLNEAERTTFLEMVVESFPSGSLFPLGSLNAASARNSTGGGNDDAEKQQTGGRLATKLSPDVWQVLQNVFRTTRTRVLTVFYKNFPEDKIARDKNKFPLLQPGDQHQITDPNTQQLVTGWDIANFPGPVSWDEEQKRRAQWMKIRWHKV